MLKVLVKKQITEVFRNYLYNPKKNTIRSKGEIATYLTLFILLIVGVLGGMFTMMAYAFCGILHEMGMGWLYFLIMSGTAVALGSFGSVFNTYSSLYMAKDNDLLLSLPIPTGTIMTARLINVYLLGTMYASTALIPMLAVYWIVTGLTPAKLICGILLYLIVTVIILMLSCMLGWIVAKISMRLKGRSYITVLASLAFIGGYYFFYFKVNDYINAILENAGTYGENIKGNAYLLYLFGNIGTGDWAAAGIFTVGTAILAGLLWTLMQRSFLKIAAAGGSFGKKVYTEKTVSQKSIFNALLGKEIARFTSSSNYMLNCGLGIVMLPVFGIYLLIKGGEMYQTLNTVFSVIPGSTLIIFCTAFCTLSSMNTIAAPSVSLEGKNIWVLQSLPVSGRQILRSKALLHMILTMIPLLFCLICAQTVITASAAERIMLCVLPVTFVFFTATAGTVLGTAMPQMNWTSEISPIKQSMAVVITMFGGFIFNAVFAAVYMIAGHQIGTAVYLLLWSILYSAAGYVLLKWLDTKGAAAFAAL